MPKFMIKRDISGAGEMSPDELRSAAQTSCAVLRNIGPQIQWVQSFVTDNHIHCIYIAPDEETIIEHARQSGFPANQISRVQAIIDPMTAEA
jgi:hypothetical protein